MDLSIYNIINGPVVTEKASELVNELKKVVLDVHPHANKVLVKEALEKLFNVRVKSVHIIIRKGKQRIFKRRKVVGKDQKRAIVTLKDDKSFDILTQTGASPIHVEQGAPSGTEKS